MEVLPNRQYKVKVDGSGRITLRNRQFLRRILPYMKAGQGNTLDLIRGMRAMQEDSVSAAPGPVEEPSGVPQVPAGAVEEVFRRSQRTRKATDFYKPT